MYGGETIHPSEKDGKWTEWYDNGQKKLEGFYKKYNKSGKWTEWFDNGQKKIEGPYKDNNKNEKWTEWFDNGQKESEGGYIIGVESDLYGNKSLRDGIWIHWNYNGQRISKENYKNDNSGNKNGINQITPVLNYPGFDDDIP